MKTLFIPLDERPCNIDFVNMIANTNQGITLFSPTKEMLGNKKIPADSNTIMNFIKEHSHQVDNIVISLDMLFYGGLIPSRIHHLTKEEVITKLEYLKTIKEHYPTIKIYAFNCIMRAPSYNSSEEEPNYYEEYGYALFRRKYLLDKQQRDDISKEEQQELVDIHIPNEIIEDYEWRRAFNTDINIEVVSYVKQEIIDFLVIPQDDSSLYGYTAISQKQVIDFMKQYHLDEKVMIYPGADEVAMSLLARAYNEHNAQTIRIYPLYASVLGPQIIPNYEDRPMLESLKSHIRVVGGKIVPTPNEADLILAINCPGKMMQEASDPKDITYTSYRQLWDFALTIKEYIHTGKRVALCDSAFSNGGDLQLIEYLDNLQVLSKLVAYAGWNTNCNTLGTVLSQSIIGKNPNQMITHLIYRIIEDVFYQSIVRKEVIEEILPTLGLSYYDFKNKQNIVEQNIAKRLLNNYQKLQLSSIYPIHTLQVNMPWKRMFEIGMSLVIKN